MIRSVAYFPLQAAKNSVPVLSAMLGSLRQSNITVKEQSLSADAVLLWSVLWAGRMANNREIYDHYRRQNKPVIVVDIGSLHRGLTWKVALNNITARGYYGHTKDLDWDRPRKLNVALQSIQSTDPTVIIAAQHSASLQVQDLDSMESWALDQVNLVRQHTDRPILIRPHPRCRLDLQDLPRGVSLDQPKKLLHTYDSFDMRFDCHAMINHNSGPGIQAAIKGTRTIVHESSLAYPVSISMQDIEQIPQIDREQWLVEICHTEYTIEELAGGLWIKRLETQLT